MRDSTADVSLAGDEVIRRVKAELPADHFLRSTLAADLVSEGKLTGYVFADPLTLVSQRVSDISYPTEWCASQFHDAAKLTLEIQARLEEVGCELKDASAWNVIFDGERPVFCDLFSVQRIERREWWAAGQFSRHFLLPLLLEKNLSLRANQIFQMYRDGMDPSQAKNMLGLSRFLSRYWPLMADTGGTPRPGLREQSGEDPSVRRFRAGLMSSLRWMLEGVAPRHSGAKASEWVRYQDSREHYDHQDLITKKAIVSTWAAQLKPARTADFGCNQGEFSQLVADLGSDVLSVDLDPGCVDRLYRKERDRLRTPGRGRISVMLARLDDASGGRGWRAGEFQALEQRLSQKFDLLLMLALIHHLSVADGIPLVEVARYAAAVTRRWLIIELIGESDPQMISLCSQRRRETSDFSLSRQREAFRNAGFELIEETPLKAIDRSLCLYRLKA